MATLEINGHRLPGNFVIWFEGTNRVAVPAKYRFQAKKWDWLWEIGTVLHNGCWWDVYSVQKGEE